MARAKASAVPSVSLFPFLSILACLSGALVVMICVLSIVQVSESRSTADANPSASQLQKLEEELAQQNLANKGIGEMLGATEEAEKRIVILKELLENPDLDAKGQVRIQLEIQNHIRVIAQLVTQKPNLQTQITKLKEELASRNIKPELLKPAIRVQGTGSGYGKDRRLFVIEATKDSLVIHKNRQDQIRVATSTIGADKEYNTYLNEVSKQKSPPPLVLFLVRSDAWGKDGSYERGAGWAENHFRLPISKLPIPGDGKVDLTEFEQSMKPKAN